MASISEKRQLRERILVALYEKTGGDRFQSVMPEELEDLLGASTKDVEQALDYLEGASMVDSSATRFMLFV